MCDREEILTVGVIMTHQVINTDTVTVRGHAAHNKYSTPGNNSLWELSQPLFVNAKINRPIFRNSKFSSLNPTLAQQMTIHRLCSQSFFQFLFILILATIDPTSHHAPVLCVLAILCCLQTIYTIPLSKNNMLILKISEEQNYIFQQMINAGFCLRLGK